MSGWSTHQGRPVVLEWDNIDTDQLIPARFMSAPRSDGYGKFLMHDLRRDDRGALMPDFPLNTTEGSILITGTNFGSGSSREAAVYALVDAGFLAVLAPSFADIFASNAVNNGLLPAQIPEAEIADLKRSVAASSEQLEISLNDCTIALAGHRWHFEVPENWRTKLINGWDDIDLTLRHEDVIETFRKDRQSSQPWAWPAPVAH